MHLDYDRADSLPQGMQHLKTSRKHGGPWSVCTLFDIGEFADTTREALTKSRCVHPMLALPFRSTFPNHAEGFGPW